MDVEGLRKWAIAVLESTDVENATLSVDWLLSEVLHVSRARLLGYPEAEVDDEAAGRFRNLIARRAEGEPLQYILGYAEFLGLRFRVCPGVLIPRPETEVLVEEVLSLIEPIARPRVLDVGTGSGCIAASIKRMRSDAEVVGCDVSDAALAVAGANAVSLGVEIRIERADVLGDDFVLAVGTGYSMVVSNPPYVPFSERKDLSREVVQFEPEIALFVHDSMLFYGCLAQKAVSLLSDSGWLVVEAHEDYADNVADRFLKAGFDNVAVRRDLSGRPRVVRGQWRTA